MVKFRQNIVIIGYGSVSQCTLPILFKLMDISPSAVTVIDFVDQIEKIRPFIEQGVKYRQERLNEENYKTILDSCLSKGDLLIDLAWNLDTISLIEWCTEKEVLFINTSVELWDPFQNYRSSDPRKLTLYHRQMLLRKKKEEWQKDGKKMPTAIVDHGANPGLVSHFTKQGLIDIAHTLLKQELQSQRRQAIENSLENKDYASLAQALAVKTIHISERDTQLTDQPKQVNEFVNTWSIEGLIEEGMAPAEMGWGTHENTLPSGALEHSEGPKNQICLLQKGAKTWVRSWVPSGPITGMVIRHGEAFSISDYLTVWSGDKPVYRPTVHYAYCPSDSTINSLNELEMRAYKHQDKKRILSDHEIISGWDELGCLLMGHDLKSWWIGTVLDIDEARELVPGQNATTIQVAIAVVAAAIYAIRHPEEGFCLPDDLDHEEILEIAKPYLGQFVSKQVDWSPLSHVEAFLDFNQTMPQLEDEWQFETFKV